MPRAYYDDEPTLTQRSARRPRGEGSQTASGRRMSRREYDAAMRETEGASDDELRERIAAESDPEQARKLRRMARDRGDALRNPRGRGARESRVFSHPVSGFGGGSSSRRRRTSSMRPTLRPPSRLSVADGSGFMLGLIGYVLALNYLRAGWPGITSWFRAKFFNDTTHTTDTRSLQQLLNPTPAPGKPAPTPAPLPGAPKGTPAPGLLTPRDTKAGKP